MRIRKIEVRSSFPRSLLAVLLFVFLLCFSWTKGADRVALVIGNSDYGEGAQLVSPEDDAAALAHALKVAGFKVIRLGDADLSEMDEALLAFGQEAAGAEASWFFYAGHAVQVSGKNYLIPVDAKITDASKIRYKAMSLNQTLSKIRRAGAQLNVVVLDCSREHPMAKTWGENISPGLSAIEAEEGMLVALSAPPGKVTEDDGRLCSPFVDAIISTLKTEGLDVSDVFEKAGKSVVETEGEQEAPWVEQNFKEAFVVMEEGALARYEAEASKVVISDPVPPAKETPAVASVVPKVGASDPAMPQVIPPAPPAGPADSLTSNTRLGGNPAMPLPSATTTPGLPATIKTEPLINGTVKPATPPNPSMLKPAPIPNGNLALGNSTKTKPLDQPDFSKNGYYPNDRVFQGGPFETVSSVTIYGALVKEVQRNLLPKGKDSGWMNTETQKAILKLQTDRGIPATGLICYQTAGLLKLKLPASGAAGAGTHSAATGTTSLPGAGAQSSVPQGSNVPGRPGLAHSPFSPGKLIDAGGRKPGEMVMDPHSNQVFQLPADFQSGRAGAYTNSGTRRRKGTIIPGKSYNSLNSNTIEGFKGNLILPAGNPHRDLIKKLQGR